jgi:O-antigen ligase
MSFIVKYSIGGMTVSEMVSLGSSYVFLMLTLMHLKKIKLDIIAILIGFFCFYLLMSGAWGGGVKEIVKLILPFTVYFAVRSSIDSERRVKLITGCLIIGFALPVAMSAAKTLRGQGVEMVVFETGITRFMGVFTGPHAIAHSMFVCLLALVLYHHFRMMEDKRSIWIMLGLSGIGLLALFNLYKSFTRNVFVGFAVFTLIYLWGTKRYKQLIISMLAVAIVAVFSSSFHDIFFDVIDPLQGKSSNYSEMGSGRLGGWGGMLSRFFSAPLVDQMRGLGISAQTTITSGAHFGGAHNDFLSVLLCFGYLGLLIYLALFFVILLAVFSAEVDRGYKVIMVSFVISVACMNLLSNSYLTRFELAQYFNLSLGAFLGLNDAIRMRNLNSLEGKQGMRS